MRTPLLAFLRQALVAAVVLAAVPAARGQSAWCRFPDPLSTAEVGAMFDRIGLAGPPRESAMQAFEAYLAERLAIARDEIAPFCTETSAPTSTEDRDREIERRLAKRMRIAARLLQVDATLADAVATAAGSAGETKARLERERLERRHWMQLIGLPFERRDGAEFTDGLAECAIAVEGDVLATLAARSGELTGLWRRLVAATADEAIEMRKAIEAAGLKRPESGDPAEWEKYIAGTQAIQAAVRGRQREIRASIRKVQRETERSLAALVGSEAALKLREWFVQRAYPSLLRPRNPVPPLLVEAERKAKAGEITAEILAEMQAIAVEHATRRAESDARLMDLLDERWAEGGGGQSFAILGGPDTESNPIQKSLELRNELDASTLARLKEAAPALASPGEAERETPRIMVGGMELEIDAGALAGGGSFVIQAGGDIGGGEGVAVIAMATEQPGGGSARPISREDLAAWAKRLGVPDESMPLLEILLEDYLGKYAEIENGPIAELGNGGPFGNPEVPASRRHDLLRDATERLLALDAEFFANLTAALTGSIDAGPISRIETERRRSVHRAAMKGEFGFGMIGMNEVESFDLATVVAGTSLSADARSAIDPLLVAYDTEMTPLFAASYLRHAIAARTVAVEQEKIMRMVEQDSQARGESRATVFAGSPDAEAMERQQAAQREMEAANAAVRTALDASVAATVAALPDEASRLMLQDAVDRASYPRLFRDPRSAGPRFDAALELPDLAPANREAIAAARQAWEAEWRRITGDMVDSRRQLVSEAGKRDGDQLPLLVANQEALQSLRFERSEANEKAMRNLKSLLTPEQAKVVGDLPPAPKRGPIMFGN